MQQENCNSPTLWRGGSVCLVGNPSSRLLQRPALSLVTGIQGLHLQATLGRSRESDLTPVWGEENGNSAPGGLV